MRGRAHMLCLILLASTLSPVLAGDVVTTEDVIISGNYTMTGNYTVSHGTTLEVKPGAVIDMGEYWMEVEGTLIASDSTIMSSIQSVGSGGHNAGVWDSITIASNGVADLTNVTISNAKSCLIVDGDLDAEELTLEHCLIGIEGPGTIDIDVFSASDIDHDGARVSGTASFTDVSMSNMTAGIYSSGDLTVSTANFATVGTAISLTGGSADVDEVMFSSAVSTAVSVHSGVTGDVTGMSGDADTAIIAMDSTGFTFSDINMTGSRLVNSWSAGDLTINNATFESDSPETVIDVRTSANFIVDGATISGAFTSSQQSYDAPWIAISLAGSGDHILSNLNVEASNTAITASGTGSLTVNDSHIFSQNVGLEMSGMASSSLNNLVVNISNGGGHGMDLLQGEHIFSNVAINMPYNSVESGSIGIEAWWSTVEADALTINGFSTSMELHDTLFESVDLTIRDSNDFGIDLYSSSVMVSDSFDTRISDVGVSLSDSSIFHANYWNASMHDTVISIGAGSTATLWHWAATSTVDEDASGDGELLYGAVGQLSISVSSTTRLYDNVVNFEDLVSNPITAEWTSLGFSGTANGGSANLPISSDGNEVVATYGGIGVSKTLTGSQDNLHTIQVPIIPIGDWVISTDVVLGATPEGLPHTAGGNITVQNGASLRVVDSTLVIPHGSVLDAKIGSTLSGTNGIISGEVISSGDSTINTLSSDNLEIVGNLSWSCQSASESHNLRITGILSLAAGCDITIYSGNVAGAVNALTGASLTIKSTLTITVLDKGEAVSGAIVKVQGTEASTNSNGVVTRTLDSRYTDSSGTTWEGIEIIEMQSGDLNDYITWDTNDSRSYTFMASTISSGSISEWLILEKIWSPYHLSNHLVIPQGQTMTIHDGVELRISEGVTIEVDGTLNAGSATMSSVGSGSRWGGLIVGDNSETTASLLGTHLVEGTPLITMDGLGEITLTDSIIARSSGSEPLIRTTTNSAGKITISNSDLSDSGAECISAQGDAVLSLFEVSTINCGDSDLWVRGNNLDITNVSLEGGADLGFVTGSINNIHSSGDIIISNNNGLTIENLILEGSISGLDNRNIAIKSAEITGSPGIDLDSSAGIIEMIKIDCNGSGVGFVAHHGRASAPLIVSDSEISNCSKGIDLHSDGESAEIEFNSVSVDSNFAISSDGYNFIFNQGHLNGSVDVAGSTGSLYDVIPTSSTASSGEIWMWTNHIFDVRLNDEAYSADLDIQIETLSWQTSVSGTSLSQSIPHTLVVGNSSQSVDEATLYATSEGLPPLNALISIGPDTDKIIVIDLIANQAPTVEIIKPDDGDRVMESEVLEVRAIVSDDLTSNSDLTVTWSVILGNLVVMQLGGEWNNVTDLDAGTYVLKLEVTDAQGQVNSQTVSFEVTLLDSDGDWIATCDSETWYDQQQSRECGPDIEDSDDDNDGINDVLDAWPTDSCASMDSDGDGQPDTLNCPIGVTTWLVEDPDDDGDGYPDVTDAFPNDAKLWDSSESSEGVNPSILILLFVFVGAIAFVFMRMRRE